MSEIATFTPKQTTLKGAVSLSGVGVHSGKMASVTLKPAGVDEGIVFAVKTANGFDYIPAKFSKVSTVKNATAIGGENGTNLCTIEHIMAAFAGLGVDNCLVEVVGGEIPILDGSSALFVEAIEQVGLEVQSRSRNSLRILKDIKVKQGDMWATLSPFADGFKIDVMIDFKNKLIGQSRHVGVVSHQHFAEEVASARTFGFLEQHEAMKLQNLAHGASLENTIIFDGEKIVNSEGMRFEDECVRHKWLDALGDLSLAGGAIIGEYRSYKGGHKLNVMMLEALFADSNNYEWTNPAPVRSFEGKQAASAVGN